MKKMISTQFFTVLILLASAITNTSYGMQRQGDVDVTRDVYYHITYFENADRISYTGFRKDGFQDTCFYIKRGMVAGRKQCYRSTFDIVSEMHGLQRLNDKAFDNLKSLYDTAKARQ